MYSSFNGPLRDGRAAAPRVSWRRAQVWIGALGRNRPDADAQIHVAPREAMHFAAALARQEPKANRIGCVARSYFQPEAKRRKGLIVELGLWRSR
jgi:hypothetical protein